MDHNQWIKKTADVQKFDLKQHKSDELPVVESEKMWMDHGWIKKAVNGSHQKDPKCC